MPHCSRGPDPVLAGSRVSMLRCASRSLGCIRKTNYILRAGKDSRAAVTTLQEATALHLKQNWMVTEMQLELALRVEERFLLPCLHRARTDVVGAPSCPAQRSRD